MTSSIVSQILECGFLDVEFLENLIEEFDIDLDIEDINKNSEKLT